jgi:hypothetical protein
MALCPPHTLVMVRAGLRAEEVAGWACTIAITCSKFHKLRVCLVLGRSDAGSGREESTRRHDMLRSVMLD